MAMEKQHSTQVSFELHWNSFSKWRKQTAKEMLWSSPSLFGQYNFAAIFAASTLQLHRPNNEQNTNETNQKKKRTKRNYKKILKTRCVRCGRSLNKKFWIFARTTMARINVKERERMKTFVKCDSLGFFLFSPGTHLFLYT